MAKHKAKHGDQDESAEKKPVSAYRLTAPHAYYTDAGDLMQWSQNQIVTDAQEIAHLKERGAPMIEIKA